MRIFKNKWFAKFALKVGLSDAKLCEVVKNVEAGKIDANYGGGVIKQRIARANEGKSGGYRSVIGGSVAMERKRTLRPKGMYNKAFAR